MIRITAADEPTLTVLIVDGRLVGDCIQVLETSCDQARLNGKPIWLHLRDVAVISEDGQELLRRLAAKGVCLKASGIYTSYLVQSIQSERAPQKAEPASTLVPTRVSTLDEIDSPLKESWRNRKSDPAADCREMRHRGATR